MGADDMRQINWDEPLSEEDKAWARQAGLPMVEDRIAANEKQFGEPASVDELDLPPDPTTRSALDPTAAGGRSILDAPPSGAPSDVQGVGAVAELEPDDYDSWKVAELKEEAATRTPPVVVASDARKPDVIQALREWDREHGETTE
jgi:hypothetical protein